MNTMKVLGTVKNGVIAVDLPDGTPVSVEVVPVEYIVDEQGRIVLTEEEWDREIGISIAEADRGEGIPWERAMEEIRKDADGLTQRQRR